jgi:hypothetical protein
MRRFGVAAALAILVAHIVSPPSAQADQKSCGPAGVPQRNSSSDITGTR